MTLKDIPLVVPMYLAYWNGVEDGVWTEETAGKYIRQVLTREASYCLLLEENGNPLAFSVGYFRQYDDCVGYTLEEILVATQAQNSGVGAAFMTELERRVKEQGAMLIELQSVNDEHHAHFYGKLGYKNASNLVVMSKML